MFAPRMYKTYGRVLDEVLGRDELLRRNFKNNNFAAMTINLGPQTVTYRHLDHLNVPWGWCAITAFGNYNPKIGGHLILWNLGIAIEFPPGATIAIPSAIIKHSNVGIGEGERRYSLTQYTAGGLVRWVEGGFQLQKTASRSNTQCMEVASERWEAGVRHWSRWDELRTDVLTQFTVQ